MFMVVKAKSDFFFATTVYANSVHAPAKQQRLETNDSVTAVLPFNNKKFGRRERERGSDGWGGGVVRDTTIVGGNIIFLFEGSQALPASPFDRGEA
jgi:hypothetical protein